MGLEEIKASPLKRNMETKTDIYDCDQEQHVLDEIEKFKQTRTDLFYYEFIDNFGEEGTSARRFSTIDEVYFILSLNENNPFHHEHVDAPSRSHVDAPSQRYMSDPSSIFGALNEVRMGTYSPESFVNPLFLNLVDPTRVYSFKEIADIAEENYNYLVINYPGLNVKYRLIRKEKILDVYHYMKLSRRDMIANKRAVCSKRITVLIREWLGRINDNFLRGKFQLLFRGNQGILEKGENRLRSTRNSYLSI